MFFLCTNVGSQERKPFSNEMKYLIRTENNFGSLYDLGIFRLKSTIEMESESRQKSDYFNVKPIFGGEPAFLIYLTILS